MIWYRSIMDRVLWPEIIMAIFSLRPAASILRTDARLKSWIRAAGTQARTRAEFQAATYQGSSGNCVPLGFVNTAPSGRILIRNLIGWNGMKAWLVLLLF